MMFVELRSIELRYFVRGKACFCDVHTGSSSLGHVNQLLTRSLAVRPHVPSHQLNSTAVPSIPWFTGPFDPRGAFFRPVDLMKFHKSEEEVLKTLHVHKKIAFTPKADHPRDLTLTHDLDSRP